MLSPKSQTIDFEHIIAHALSCTLENEDVSAMEYWELKFGSIDEVIKVEDLMCFDVCKGVAKEACSSG